MRVERIVKRQGQRAQLAALRRLLATHKPLVQAQRVLDAAYQAGFTAAREGNKPQQEKETP